MSLDMLASTIKGPFFSLENIVPWKRLAALKNGFQAGGRTLLLPSSGVKAWLSFLRIFIEVSFQIWSWTKIEFSCCSGVQWLRGAAQHHQRREDKRFKLFLLSKFPQSIFRKSRVAALVKLARLVSTNATSRRGGWRRGGFMWTSRRYKNDT